MRQFRTSDYISHLAAGLLHAATADPPNLCLGKLEGEYGNRGDALETSVLQPCAAPCGVPAGGPLKLLPRVSQHPHQRRPRAQLPWGWPELEKAHSKVKPTKRKTNTCSKPQSFIAHVNRAKEAD